MKISKVLAIFSLLLIASCGKQRVLHNDTFIKVSKPFVVNNAELNSENLKLPVPNPSLTKFGWKQAKDVLYNQYATANLSVVDFNKEYGLKTYTKDEIEAFNKYSLPQLFRYHVLDKESFNKEYRKYLLNNKKYKIDPNNVKLQVKKKPSIFEGIF